jgi:hypothetical protein
MINKSLFIRAFLLLCIIAFLNFLGNALYLHWTIWWFDNTLHFLAGGCIALGILSIYFPKSSELKQIVYRGVFIALVIGIVWEVFEWYFDITSFKDGAIFVLDTISDIIMDTTGALLASLYTYKLVTKDFRNE